MAKWASLSFFLCGDKNCNNSVSVVVSGHHNVDNLVEHERIQYVHLLDKILFAIIVTVGNLYVFVWFEIQVNGTFVIIVNHWRCIVFICCDHCLIVLCEKLGGAEFLFKTSSELATDVQLCPLFFT